MTVYSCHTELSAPIDVEDIVPMIVYPAVSNASNEPHSIELQSYANTNNTYNNNTSAQPADRSVLTNCDFIIEHL